MGAWGPGEFENDSALDWLAEVQDTDDLLDACREAFQSALDEDYLDSDPASAAVAAACVLAAFHDGYRGPVPDDIGISGVTVDPALRRLAVRALEAVAAADSELASLWEDAGDTSWRATIDVLVKRLR